MKATVDRMVPAAELKKGDLTLSPEYKYLGWAKIVGVELETICDEVMAVLECTTLEGDRYDQFVSGSTLFMVRTTTREARR